VAYVRTTLSVAGTPNPDAAALLERVLERVVAVPGIGTAREVELSFLWDVKRCGKLL
jgi:hypothetical protein